MITCPWCGTNYAAFQSNCDRCGGPLPLPSEAAASRAEGDLPTPPPAPRQVADSYAWRLLISDGWGVAALVFTILGTVFTVLGAALTLGVITAFVGLPFLALGLFFLVAGVAIGLARLRSAQQTVDVLRHGQATVGQIARVEQNLAVRVNNRHPWVISYQFRIQDFGYDGTVTTLNPPGPALQPGKAASILYLPDSPKHNVLYPHP